tara:strand:+ start:78 stop:557 length:480 start_codon:yes stop_codon:yes gene_type:complete
VGKSLKDQILKQLLDITSKQLEQAKASYESALAHSRSDDMKSEGKYDTRAIEAGYLTSAKKQRMEQLERELLSLSKLSSSKCEKAILGALILLECEDKKSWYYLSCACGGETLTIDSEKIHVITTTSPIGKEVLGLEEGDSFELENSQGVREFELIECR